LAFADRYLPGRDPVGREIVLAPQESRRAIRIVGVAANAREEGYIKAAEPIVYACGFLRWLPDSDFLIRTRGEPATLTRSVREAIRQIEPGRAVYAVQPLSEALAQTLAQRRFRALLVSAFSAIALTLAGIGLYGVLTYMVVQRSQEFGVRMALGASRTTIAGEILRSAGLLTSAGALVGLLLAALAARLLTAFMTEVPAPDPVTDMWVAGLLLGVALVACIGPGWRALSIEPIQALRD
jgi:predicted lysophospholipase L1 biosynthesis ABC-type transport system permease subunit